MFRPPNADLEGLPLEQDLIYVGGGNTKSMLALWRGWGQGVVLVGLSTGAICWFEQGHTDSVPGPLSPLPCQGAEAVRRTTAGKPPAGQ